MLTCRLLSHSLFSVLSCTSKVDMARDSTACNGWVISPTPNIIQESSMQLYLYVKQMEAISQLRCPLLRYASLVSTWQKPTSTTCEIILTDARWGLSQTDHRASQNLEKHWTMVVVVGRISLLFTLVLVSSGVILFLAALNMVWFLLPFYLAKPDF